MIKAHWFISLALGALFAYGWSPILSPLISFPIATAVPFIFIKCMAWWIERKPAWSIVMLGFRETVLVAAQLAFLFKDIHPYEISFSTNNNYYLDNNHYSVLNATIALFASFVFLAALTVHTLVYRIKHKLPLISFSIAQIVAVILTLAMPLYLNVTPESIRSHGARYGWPFLAFHVGVEMQVIWIALLLNLFLLLTPVSIYLFLRGNPVLQETRSVSIARVVTMVAFVVFFAYLNLVWKLFPELWGWPYYFRIYDYDRLRILFVDLYYLAIYCFAIFNIRPNPARVGVAG